MLNVCINTTDVFDIIFAVWLSQRETKLSNGKKRSFFIFSTSLSVNIGIRSQTHPSSNKPDLCRNLQVFQRASDVNDPFVPLPSNHWHSLSLLAHRLFLWFAVIPSYCIFLRGLSWWQKGDERIERCWKRQRDKNKRREERRRQRDGQTRSGQDNVRVHHLVTHGEGSPTRREIIRDKEELLLWN